MGINPGESVFKRKTPANDNFFVKDRRKHRTGSGVVPDNYVWRKSYKSKGKTIPGRYVKPRGKGKSPPTKRKTPEDDNFFRKNRKLHKPGSGVVPKDYRWKPRKEYMRKGKKVVVPGRYVPPMKQKAESKIEITTDKQLFDTAKLFKSLKDSSVFEIYPMETDYDRKYVYLKISNIQYGQAKIKHIYNIPSKTEARNILKNMKSELKEGVKRTKIRFKYIPD